MGRGRSPTLGQTQRPSPLQQSCLVTGGSHREKAASAPEVDFQGLTGEGCPGRTFPQVRGRAFVTVPVEIHSLCAPRGQRFR